MNINKLIIDPQWPFFNLMCTVHSTRFPQKTRSLRGFFSASECSRGVGKRGELDKTLGVTPRSLIPAACITLA